ncbi:MAG TPA: FAD-dependent oxidoreductase [Candidatus Nanopelagicaceae bacterium]
MSRPRVVIVGNGMAGSRVAEEVRANDPQRLVDLTVIGAETGVAYNRILLSEVLAGRHHASDIALTVDDWHRSNEVRLRTGSPVVRIDRVNRFVETQEGDQTEYDALVLATGSRPWMPPLTGLFNTPQLLPENEIGTPELIPGSFVFRTLDDCTAIEAAVATATRAVVLGGGLLGIEAARGLAGRGLPVVLVHLADHLMERQLDATAGKMLARTLGDLGVTTRLSVSAVAVIRDGDGAFGGLTLDDGSCVLGDLLIIATGVRPEVDVARETGLEVGLGIVVDDNMRSISDRRIFAVGECAQHNGSVYGLVAPAWDQASVVAAQITGADPQNVYRGSRIVTRLKATGVDLASFGDPFAQGDDIDVLQVSDPGRGIYSKVLLREERIIGAILLGQIESIATLTGLFDRNAPLPYGRLALMMPTDEGAAPAESASPLRMPGNAIVCRCNGVTKAKIQKCILEGARSVETVAKITRATTGCGSCIPVVTGIIDWLSASDPVNPEIDSEIDSEIDLVAEISQLTNLETIS